MSWSDAVKSLISVLFFLALGNMVYQDLFAANNTDNSTTEKRQESVASQHAEKEESIAKEDIKKAQESRDRGFKSGWQCRGYWLERKRIQHRRGLTPQERKKLNEKEKLFGCDNLRPLATKEGFEASNAEGPFKLGFVSGYHCRLLAKMREELVDEDGRLTRKERRRIEPAMERYSCVSGLNRSMGQGTAKHFFGSL